MDARNFDRLSRHVGAQRMRRTMLRSALGGALALLGAGAVGREVTAAATGYNGDPCFTAADCQTGLVCQGGSTGILGGTLAGGPYGPPSAAPLLEGSSGRCRYHSSCGAKSDQACRNTGDCCSGLNLHCHNNTCRRRN
jgi:hypothetical protein